MLRIEKGRSGANVYEIDNDQILKYVRRYEIKNDMFDTYTREALFYQSKKDSGADYIPEVLDIELSDDEIIMLLKKYDHPKRADIEKKIERIIRTLVYIHTDSIPDFLKATGKKKEPLTGDRIEYCMKGWKSVLAEHKNVFDEKLLDQVSGKINDVIEWHNGEECRLIHGDFHWDNLLEGDNGKILVCDWQGVGTGGASTDLSFFISRLGADGIDIEPGTILKIYSDAMKEISGQETDVHNIKRHIAAANVITTFEFWHEYLHGNDENRVKGIFDRMVADLNECT